MSKFAAHHFYRVEDDNEFAVALPPTLVGTEEGNRLRDCDPRQFYGKLYEQQIQQVGAASYDPLPGSEAVPGQRAAVVAALASFSPSRQERPQWRAVQDRVKSADHSSPRTAQDRALVLGKPCLHAHTDDSNGSLALRAEAALEGRVAPPLNTNDSLERATPQADRHGISQAQLRAEAAAMTDLLNQFNANGRPLTQETKNALKELIGAASDLLD